MSLPGQKTVKSKHVPTRKFIRVIFQLLFVLIALAGLLFIPAGRLSWADAWIYLIAYGIFLFAYAAWGLFKDPGQFEERSRARTGREDQMLLKELSGYNEYALKIRYRLFPGIW